MITLGIIGAGYWGPNLIRNFNQLKNCEIKYICDREEGRRNFIKKEYPHISVIDDYYIILKDEEVSAVIIATPVDTHYKLGMKSLKHKKDIFIEKPFTSNVKEARDLTSLSNEVNKIIMVGHIYEYHPAIRKIKELITQNIVGEVYYIKSSRTNMGPPKSEVDVIMDLAPHDLSIILYFLEEYPSQIYCSHQSFDISHWQGLIQVSDIRLEFNDNISASIYNSWLTPFKQRRIEIVCSKGVVLYDEISEHIVTIFGEGIDNRKEGGSSSENKLAYWTGDVIYPHIDDFEPLRQECNHFIECLINREEPLSNGSDGLNVMQIIEQSHNY